MASFWESPWGKGGVPDLKNPPLREKHMKLFRKLEQAYVVEARCASEKHMKIIFVEVDVNRGSSQAHPSSIGMSCVF